MRLLQNSGFGGFSVCFPKNILFSEKITHMMPPVVFCSFLCFSSSLFSIFKIWETLHTIENIREIFPRRELNIPFQKRSLFFTVSPIKNIKQVMTSYMYLDLLHMKLHIVHSLQIFSDYLYQSLSASDLVQSLS